MRMRDDDRGFGLAEMFWVDLGALEIACEISLEGGRCRRSGRLCCAGQCTLSVDVS